MGFLKRLKKKRPEFYLENAIEKNIKFPRTFLIPDQEDIDKLVIGDLVKLIFVMEKTPKEGCKDEKLWVEIISIQDEVLTGIISNEPSYLKSIKVDDEVTFKLENIADIYGKN